MHISTLFLTRTQNANKVRINTRETRTEMRIIMFVVNILAFMAAALFLACFFRESLVSVLPLTACALIAELYLLAFAGHLSATDLVSVLLLAAALIWLVCRGRGAALQEIRAKLTESSFLTVLVLLLVVGICVSGKVVTWWDDVNFWATDVKSLYALDGFAGKYTNAASEFGDYPPGAQLFKWWFVHMDPAQFREGLAFAGYYTLNLLFLAPLLGKVRGRNVPVLIMAAVSLWLFPGIAEVYGYQGFCADLTMACIYGNVLYAVVDREEHTELFYYGRIGMYLGLLVLVKSVGFIWAGFGIVFLVLHHLLESRRGQGARRGLLPVMAVAACPVLSGGSWMLFCLIMRRVTKTTATAVKYMTTDEYGLSGYMGDFAGAFAEAFFTLPLHKDKGLVIDLTPLACYLVICAVVIFLYKKKLLPERTGRLILWFGVISGALFYAIIFLAHITIFATETQYLEAAGMISSIERYGAPFTVGTLLFLALLWMERGERMFAGRSPFWQSYGTILVFVLFTALTAQWETGYDGLIGYRAHTEEALQTRSEMQDDASAALLEALRELQQPQARVLVVQEDEASRWVRNSYTNMEAAPVSLVYQGVRLEDATQEWLTEIMRASHAGYLFVNDTQADTGVLFDAMTQGAPFETQTLYQIVEGEGGICLTAVSAADEGRQP